MRSRAGLFKFEGPIGFSLGRPSLKCLPTTAGNGTGFGPFDTVSVCFSKGLGAPVGSALAGTGTFIERARRFKQMFGGGFRQAGVLAAAALHAVEHHRRDLESDHRKARELASALADLDEVDIDTSLVQTNIVRFRLKRMSAAAFVEGCHERGLYLLVAGPDRVRAVLHRDVRPEDVPEAASVIRDVIKHNESI